MTKVLEQEKQNVKAKPAPKPSRRDVVVESANSSLAEKARAAARNAPRRDWAVYEAMRQNSSVAAALRVAVSVDEA